MDYKEYKNFKENTTHGNSMLAFVKYFSSIPSFFPFYPLHWHEEIEIIYVKGGQGTVWVNLSQQVVTAGDIIMISPGLLHSIGQSETEYMEYDTLVFHTNMLISYPPDSCTIQYLSPLLHNEMLLPVILRQDDPIYQETLSYVQQLISLYEKKQPGYELMLKATLFMMFHLFYSKQRVLKGHKTLFSDERIDKLKQIIRYIEENYQKELYIQDIAQLCGFSSSHFMKFFKLHMGVTFTQYVNEYRLNAASQLLKSTNLPVLEIAYETGYDNLSYFNRTFKQKFQMTPTKFRNSH